MAPERRHGFLDGIHLRGRNAGASMSIRHGSTYEPQDCCCINIYINNNIQGVNNSVLLGSEVRMRDPGVRIYLKDELWVESQDKEMKTGGNSSNKLRLGLAALLMLIFMSFVVSTFL
ncbi:hypothetical protein K2173_013682 [Erythroxylum novogranatense]|uniref:Uncharacterized protein n=1 Tax=Erythroxylum novogranatense TaxID=1862640 RepID=A0AAV8SAL5_9ROSI|nr:hypothetical protein K2173_013682 [Erythroxylum novogranatense]